MEKSKTFKHVERLPFAVFLLYFLVTCYKLTNAPLWFDETVEYWYSKILYGRLPFEAEPHSMYQRIVSTFQPPLYNWIMFFWLKISTSEWWFRFFGVIMGFFGNVGIFRAVKKAGSTATATAAVFTSIFVYQLVYYWQECSEYCLMLGLLCWTIYFFICVIEEMSFRNILLFTAFSVLPIYSQYGSAFPVLSMDLAVLIHVLLKKEKKTAGKLLISYSAAVVFAAVPLFFLFMSRQGGVVSVRSLTFDKNVIYDLCTTFVDVVRWNLFSYCDRRISIVFAVLFIVLLAAGAVFIKKPYFRLSVMVNVLTWVLYYLSVKIGVYGRGAFGNRYQLFFIPLWIVTGFCIVSELLQLIRQKEKAGVPCRLIQISGLVLLFCFMLSSWNLKLKDNWDKEDMRGALKVWMENRAYDSNTLVYYGGNSGFAYYLRQNDSFHPDMEKNVVYMKNYRSKTKEEYREYLSSIYGEQWPEELYFIGTHSYKKEHKRIISAFLDEGYSSEYLFRSNGFLVRLTKPA